MGLKPSASHHGMPGGKRRIERKRSTVFLDLATKAGHRQIRLTLELPQRRQGGMHMGLPLLELN